jgi:hypothetical protein
MAISGTLNTTTLETSSGTILAEKSVAHVSGAFTGYVSLQTAPTGTTDLVTIMHFAKPTAMPVSTPDTSMIFRFASRVTSGNAEVYLGA